MKFKMHNSSRLEVYTILPKNQIFNWSCWHGERFLLRHSFSHFFFSIRFFSRSLKNHGAKRAPIMYWRRNKFSLTDQLISVMGILAVDKNFFNTMISLFYRLPDDWVEKVLSCVFAAVAFSCEKTEVWKKKKTLMFLFHRKPNTIDLSTIFH